MILRIQKRENPYAQIDNRALNDSRLSWRARGILAYLLSKPDNWQVVIEDLIKQSPDGRDAVRSGMRELTKAGYLELVAKQDESGRMQGKEYILYETPKEMPVEDRENRTTGFPSVGKSPTNNTYNKVILNNSLSMRESERKSFKKPTNLRSANCRNNLDERFQGYLTRIQLDYPVLYSTYPKCKLLLREEYKTIVKYIDTLELEKDKQRITNLVYKVHADMNKSKELIGEHPVVSGLVNKRLREQGFPSITEMYQILSVTPAEIS